MNIIGFADVDFHNEESVKEFIDLNSMAHETIFDRILSKGKISEHVPLFTDEISPDWLMTHAQAHKDESIAMGLAPTVGLDTLYLDSPEQVGDWISSHYLDHQYKALFLGL